jgi:hypothetical protein
LPLTAVRVAAPPWSRRRDGATVACLVALLMLCYSANGREISSYDSRPTALAARELLLRGTTSLNHVVGETPAYADRWGFILAKHERYRSIYSPVPSLLAAALTWPFWRMGAIDVTAPLAPALMAKTTASLLITIAVALGYATARRWLARPGAVLLAVGLGLGTGFWNSASQTLWQTETEAFGLAAAVLAFTRIDEPGATGAAVVLGAGLALAGAARPQLGPAVGILLAGCWWRGRRADAALATVIVILGTIAICWTNWRWFGSPMGALPRLQDVNASLHQTGRTFAVHVEPYLGLLISPSRGLLVFSPIVAVALIGVPAACRAGSRSPLPWYALAFAAELVLYASYSVWWGGHTYGPRYLLDALPLLVPLAAVAMAARWRWPAKSVAALALAWSIALAATGAFCYPHDAWNTDPTDIDRDHARLWSWSDPQFVRCWRQGPSPQNFALLDQAALRRTARPASR